MKKGEIPSSGGTGRGVIRQVEGEVRGRGDEVLGRGGRVEEVGRGGEVQGKRTSQWNGAQWRHNGGSGRIGYRRPHSGHPSLPDDPCDRPRAGQPRQVLGPQTEICAVSFEGV